jgi:hypothetical protein
MTSDPRARVIEEIRSPYFYERVRHRLEGLTDDEYLWQPVSGSLTVDGETNRVVRTGPVNFSTIAWRLCHVIDTLREERNWRWLGREAPAVSVDVHRLRAADAVAQLDAAWAAWSELTASVSIDEMWQPIGEVGGPFADRERFTFVLHVIDELIHHSAEIGVLRDLYAATSGGRFS